MGSAITGLCCLSLLTTACDPAREFTAGAAGGASLQQGLAAGHAAPEVELLLQDSRRLRLSSLKGKGVVLYFYPMDDTPGCRLEARGFRDRLPAFSSKNVVVFGVSMQNAESHRAFIDKEQLNFDLVVDDGTVARAFQVPVRAQLTARQTVLIDPQGIIQQIWRETSPATHPGEVLAALSN